MDQTSTLQIRLGIGSVVEPCLIDVSILRDWKQTSPNCNIRQSLMDVIPHHQIAAWFLLPQTKKRQFKSAKGGLEGKVIPHHRYGSHTLQTHAQHLGQQGHCVQTIASRNGEKETQTTERIFGGRMLQEARLTCLRLAS